MGQIKDKNIERTMHDAVHLLAGSLQRSTFQARTGGSKGSIDLRVRRDSGTAEPAGGRTKKKNDDDRSARNRHQDPEVGGGEEEKEDEDEDEDDYEDDGIWFRLGPTASSSSIH